MGRTLLFNKMCETESYNDLSGIISRNDFFFLFIYLFFFFFFCLISNKFYYKNWTLEHWEYATWTSLQYSKTTQIHKLN